MAGFRWVASTLLGVVILSAMSIRILMYLPAWRNDVTMAKATLKEDPNAAPFWIYLGLGYLKAGDRNQARAAFLCAVATPESPFEASVDLALMQLEDRQYRGAEATLDRVIKRDYRHVLPVIMLSDIEKHKGDFRRCRDLLRRAYAIEPDNPAILARIGKLACLMGQRDTAYVFFFRAVELGSKEILECGNP